MSALGREIREMIAAEGPIDVARYMELALAHLVHGYYRTRDPLGRAGDFTTAPEISQMFGELIGLWAAEVWHGMGRPERLVLVELGPGRGTLMADALRAARVLPGFVEAVDLHLVEMSPVLRAAQERALRERGVPVAWHDDLAQVPAGPAIVIANEFLDALPIRQFVMSGDGWHERLVGLDAAGALAFGLAARAEPRIRHDGQPGDVLEVSEAALATVQHLASRLVRDGGAALLVDYGDERGGSGDTLQAVHRHAFADVLADPGACDLTAHVDFGALAGAAARAGALPHGPVAQGDFLAALGIEARAARLKAGADKPAAQTVQAALSRLTGTGEGDMGALFKVFGLSAGIGELPGLPRRMAAVRSAREGMIETC